MVGSDVCCRAALAIRDHGCSRLQNVSTSGEHYLGFRRNTVEGESGINGGVESGCGHKCCAINS